MLRQQIAGQVILVACATWALACTGTTDSSLGKDGSQTANFPRLTHPQWENTVQDLFRLNEPPQLATSFQPDPPIGRYDNNIDRLQVSSSHWVDYQRAAEDMAERVTSTPAILDSITPAREFSAFIQRFGTRAFRRPITETEIDRYRALYDKGPKHYPDLDPFVGGTRLVINAILQSPFFLYRTELTGLDKAGLSQLTNFEIASRLSYTFTNSMPDDALLSAAAAGELDSPEGIATHIAILLGDSRSQEQFTHFHFQAFKLRDWSDIEKNTDVFPDWRKDIGKSMQTEMEMFLGQILFSGGTIRDLLTSRTTFVNSDLAEIYGLTGNFGEEFIEVELNPAERSGFMTRAGFLTRNATLTQPDPIHRGVFLNLNLLCRELPAVPVLPDEFNFIGDTNRERINSITGEGTCGESCHGAIINPLGFALENFDAIGRYRENDNGFPVDAADLYWFEDGREIKFNNSIELSKQLAEAPEVHACYLSNIVEYMFGRSLEEGDKALIEKLAQQSVDEDIPLRGLISEVASSTSFRYRLTSKGEGQ